MQRGYQLKIHKKSIAYRNCCFFHIIFWLSAEPQCCSYDSLDNLDILAHIALDFSILITGETGVGKELVARAIHAASRRSDLPLLYVNCANLTENLAESELFGHTKSAFTGATNERIGKFELADAGTLFLDEIGELPPSVQPRLLRVLQEGEVQKLGSAKVKHVDVRILAATMFGFFTPPPSPSASGSPRPSGCRPASPGSWGYSRSGSRS